ncbi:interleukin-1 receptor-like 2 isoform X1 [Sciurus carolinensis]|uniref:interleukin-1 receptor-like 2 isoform X1 n=2 Tax=Sciurus carolinensis TaxID=30640 RepID=UPI001FB56115|nr:interleukin-1 receptor-like 2 isoform X1 [Sciurus carolinensis]XP_047377788.1 interleukin-1 receptor-like 2 isoform X1 [Sciurus carolinensis]XP_047377789.1 interleukin-1 receptor-like 2 isoform X1 [Sciurus carolinensis]XP_047377790.1 interleukin-1 receptor-like 2 isoform X1 [Sciurus carolinensis]
MRTRSLLLCGVSIALPLLVRADTCKDTDMQHETTSADQPFAFNCTYPPLTYGEVNVMWYLPASKSPVSKDKKSRIHQEHTWILILPLKLEDSGIYLCVIKNADDCLRIWINLTVFEKPWCNTSRRSLPNLSDDYKQILHIGFIDSLTCHLDFPETFVLASIMWYKDCKLITGARFVPLEGKLFVYNVSEEDSGSYACTAKLTHEGRSYMIVNSINVSIIGRAGNGRRIPKIIYPKNNSIEVQLGSALIVDCNITDSKENTNLRCWRVNNTLVDTYYSESKRIQEGIETNVSFPEYIFYTVNITFLEVKMEDYGLPFMCHAGVSTAYFILTLPAPDFRAYLIGGLITLAILVTSVLCIYNYFKIDIVLWYRSAFCSTKTIEDGKLYDAYVLYPKPRKESQRRDVDTLVLKLLPAVLEGQCRYKLFIFGRDEFPGQAVANVIDENIKLCRRLILILVPESPSVGLLTNMSAEQIAVYNALIQVGMKVILIELEKIEDYSTMPESVQYLRQKHGAIRWTGDLSAPSPSAKTKFWKRVRYHMPPRSCPPACSPAAEARTLRLPRPQTETRVGLITH